VVDLIAESTDVDQAYSNTVINEVNQHCLRLAVFDGDYPWHHHPSSDELLVVKGCLLVDLADGRTVNLCFEERATDTIFVDRPADP
jgi:hypothetical protein